MKNDVETTSVSLEGAQGSRAPEQSVSVATLFAYMVEREGIRIRKEAGEPRPWTDDPILNEYSFTNVRRADDRTTQTFKRTFYEPNVSAASVGDVLFNCALARFFGRAEPVLHIGWQKAWDADAVVERARSWQGSLFTSAYVITNNGQKGDKVEFVCRKVLTPLWRVRSEIAEAAIRENGWRFLIGLLKQLPGLGGTGFMAKEVAQDFMLATGWIPRDRDTYTPIGKGARRGLNRLKGRPVDWHISSSTVADEERFLKEARSIFDLRHGYLPEQFVELQLHDIQFNLCELDKYLRAKSGEGRPKRRYRE